MKVFAIGKGGLYLRLGESQEQSRWYVVTKKVVDVTKNVQRGDTVDIQFDKREDGKFYLTSVKKTGSAPLSPEGIRKPSEYSRPKTPEERADIRSQAIGHMTSRGLIALQGQVDINNITNVAETLYKKFRELVERR